MKTTHELASDLICGHRFHWSDARVKHALDSMIEQGYADSLREYFLWLSDRTPDEETPYVDPC
jgi:hypothetical protein